MPRLVDHFVEGNKGLKNDIGFTSMLIAYGQTGSGKSHTLFGDDEFLKDPTHQHWGLCPKLLKALLW